MSDDDYRTWDTDRVASWTSSINPVFAKYADSFRGEVTGDMLPDLDDGSLVDLGMSSKLHRKRMLRAVAELMAKDEGEEEKEKGAEKEKAEVKKEAKKEEGDDDNEEDDAEGGGRKRPARTGAAKGRAAKRAKKEEEEAESAPRRSTRGRRETKRADVGGGGGDDDDEEEGKEKGSGGEGDDDGGEDDEGAPPPSRDEKIAEDAKTGPPEIPDVSEGVEVCISFDTTGSMYPCLSQVRRDVQSTVRRLLSDIPHIRIALVAHGDYGDEGETYVIKTLNFTSDEAVLVDWVRDVGQTCGYDADECYELVLRDVQKLAWSPMCRNRSLVLIGDSNPHPLNKNNPHHIDWKEEAKKLRDMDVRVYAIHALSYGNSKLFYESLARMTSGTYLSLSQFSSVVHFICGICYRQSDRSQLESYEMEVRSRPGGTDRAVRALFDALLGREAAAVADRPDGLRPVRGGRFQVLEVDAKTPIKVFAQKQGLTFKAGRGFYQFTKPEHISTKKEIVLVHKGTGDMFTGEAAQTLLGITAATAASKVKIQPSDLGEFDVFVQSTSWNRGLVAGTKFLYEVDNER